MTSSVTVDRIVELLRNEVSRSEIQSVLAQQDTQVTQFVMLLVKAEEKKKTDEGKKDAAVTIVEQCKP